MKRLIDKYDADSQSGSTQTKIKPAPSVSSQVHNLGKKEGTGRVPRGVDVSAANIPRNVVSSGQPDQQQNNVRQIPTLQARHEGEVGVVPLNRHQSTPATVPWLEKFVDRIVGDDETTKTRYALICKKCYCHNGLVLEEEIRTIQYYCPKCSYFNASLISLEQKKVEITAELMNLDEKNTDINTVRPAKDDLGTDEKQNPETPEMKTPTKAETENSKPSKSPKNRNSAKKAKSHQKKSSS
ncbi:Protein lunapark [Zancudomyces culisetae]|uniref:Endoplasmic reticulum junction formation protein lunapark n=1 Tax=Zancudomyces culisetae TaxID=1213189 RepID=A0A1R1PR98_ZANCU|nr:Protein lunapark [Zancudomyces culisetae]|eukprot:OMH83505.1 Protein lunapark [Zancudomyces culisetae]